MHAALMFVPAQLLLLDTQLPYKATFRAGNYQPRRTGHAYSHLAIMREFNPLIQGRLQDGVTVLDGDCLHPPLSLNLHFISPADIY